MRYILSVLGSFFLVGGSYLIIDPVVEGKESTQKRKYPNVVMIIRHAEKPPEDANSVDLSAEGMKRAEALPQLFQASTNRPTPFPAPDFFLPPRIQSTANDLLKH